MCRRSSRNRVGPIETQPAAGSGTAFTPSADDGAPGVALVVDPGPESEALEAELGALGWWVDVVGEPGRFLSASSERSPDVVVVDAQSPTIDAPALLRAMPGDVRLGEVAVVLLADDAAGAEVQEGLRLGAHDVLRRPVAPGEVAVRAGAALRTTRLRRRLRHQQAEMEAISRTDPLTRLGNRRQVEDHLEMAASAARRQHQPLSVLMIDVDYFKRVNESAGRAGGDEVLRSLARRLTSMLRTEDVAGRWGGGELLVVLPATALDGAWMLADRIRLAVCDEPVPVPNGEELVVTVSIGCATGVGDDPEGQLRRAEEALAEAKAGGRNRVVADTAVK